MYVGTVQTNHKGLPTSFRNKQVKSDDMRIPLSSKFVWKKDSPVMAVSYVPKENQNVLLITTAHDTDGILNNTQKKKPVVIDFYNSQRCSVDVVNEMLKDYSSQPVSNIWTIVVFTFILDSSAVNGSTIFKYNCQTKFTNRRAYLKNLALQLCTPHLVERLSQKKPKHPLSYSDRNCIRRYVDPTTN